MTKLTLSNFEQQVSSTIVQRGKQYYKNGYVADLEELDDGHWSAEVEGSDIYAVHVQLHGMEIMDCDCDCPYDGYPCKHAVAVWYALREQQPGVIEINPEKERKKKSSFSDLLAEISIEEYRTFVVDYAKRNADFKTDFELYFAHKGSGVDVEQKYAEIIKKTIRKHSDRGFIDYRSSSRLASDIDHIMAAGHDYLQKRNYRDAFLLTKAILMPIMDAMKDADDSNGSIGGAASGTIGLIGDLAKSADIPRSLQLEILSYVHEQLKEGAYFSYGDFGWELLDVFEALTISLGEEGLFLGFVDWKLAVLNGQYDGYKRSTLICAKIDFLEKIGRGQEAKLAEEQNMHIADVRKGVVYQAIQQKDYAKAKELIGEGIRLAESENLPGLVGQWEEELLAIAEFEKDVDKIRHYTKKFAFARYGLSKEHYRQWKATYEKEAWVKVIESHVQQIIEKTTKEWKAGNSYWRPPYPPLLSALADIYIEEGYLDRLFELVKLEKELDAVLRYHDVLKARYATELLDLYVPALEAYGHKTSSRGEYADLVRKMERIIKDVPQGRERILAVARQLKETYSVKPRRPAMLEELSKLV